MIKITLKQNLSLYEFIWSQNYNVYYIMNKNNKIKIVIKYNKQKFIE